MNPTKKYLTLAALAAAFAISGIATAADKKNTTPESRAGAAKQRDPEALFKRLDANGDGKITKEEFEKVRERLQKAKRAAATSKGEIGERILKRLDTNNDGALSLDEFKKMSEMRAGAEGRNLDPEKAKQLRERRRAAGGDAAKKSATEEKPKEPSK